MRAALANYLGAYGESEAALLNGLEHSWRHALVVPAFREAPAFLQRYLAWLRNQRNTLLILVLNRPDAVVDSNWAQPLLALLPARRWQSGTLALHTLPAGCAVLTVDRCIAGAPLPAKQGVGLARRIGSDIACALYAQGLLQSPWLGQSDADAALPADYFTALDAVPDDRSACVFPFRHRVDSTTAAALPTLIYEFQLLYYALGLQHARSPYAFTTVGSAMAVNLPWYAKARGFPKRAGGEDFYLLNKLAKLAPIERLPAPTIVIDARESDRVPFGTGPAVKRLRESGDGLNSPCYHPQGFALLAQLLHCIDQLLAAPKLTLSHAEAQITQLHPALLSALRDARWEHTLQHCYRQGRDHAARLRHWHTWLDAFRTLKLLHHLRDHLLGTATLQELLTGDCWFNAALVDQQNASHNWLIPSLRNLAQKIEDRGPTSLPSAPHA